MFTGLVAGVGTLESRLALAAGERYRLRQPFGQLALGESIAIAGACLTVVELDDAHIAVELSPETLARTTLGTFVPGTRVNLERALLASDRLGGHLVTGHVDGVGSIVGLEPLGEMMRVNVRVPAELARFVAEKGSLTVDGVSLTVNSVSDEAASLLVIPHTRSVTTLGTLEVGQPVNLEVDLVARYVERLLSSR